jgi:hypothetical protein
MRRVLKGRDLDLTRAKGTREPAHEFTKCRDLKKFVGRPILAAAAFQAALQDGLWLEGSLQAGLDGNIGEPMRIPSSAERFHQHHRRHQLATLNLRGLALIGQ